MIMRIWKLQRLKETTAGPVDVPENPDDGKGIDVDSAKDGNQEPSVKTDENDEDATLEHDKSQTNNESETVTEDLSEVVESKIGI